MIKRKWTYSHFAVGTFMSNYSNSFSIPHNWIRQNGDQIWHHVYYMKNLIYWKSMEINWHNKQSQLCKQTCTTAWPPTSKMPSTHKAKRGHRHIKQNSRQVLQKSNCVSKWHARSIHIPKSHFHCQKEGKLSSKINGIANELQFNLIQ